MTCDLGSRPGADPQPPARPDKLQVLDAWPSSLLSSVPDVVGMSTGGMAALVKQSRALWKAETYIRATKCLVHSA